MYELSKKRANVWTMARQDGRGNIDSEEGKKKKKRTESQERGTCYREMPTHTSLPFSR